MRRHAHLVDKERYVARLVEIAMLDFQRWKRVHPAATTLEELAEIYAGGNRILRAAR